MDRPQVHQRARRMRVQLDELRTPRSRSPSATRYAPAPSPSEPTAPVARRSLSPASRSFAANSSIRRSSTWWKCAATAGLLAPIALPSISTRTFLPSAIQLQLGQRISRHASAFSTRRQRPPDMHRRHEIAPQLDQRAQRQQFEKRISGVMRNQLLLFPALQLSLRNPDEPPRFRTRIRLLGHWTRRLIIDVINFRMI